MSEVDTRAPTRGRSSHRGGRGGLGRGGPRGGRKQTNGSSNHDVPAIDDSLDDQGELGEMKRQYGQHLPSLKDMFPEWTDVDLVFALQECDGDINATVDRISQGNVSQFSEVKKVKDRARSKVKDELVTAGTDKAPNAPRSSRGRGGLESSRGRGGRATDRARGGHRSRGGHATTDSSTKESDPVSVPTTESSAWASDAHTSAPAAESTTEAPAAATESKKESSGPISAVKKTWASMFTPAPKPAAPTQGKKSKAVEAPTISEPSNSVDRSTAAQTSSSAPQAILNEATQPAILAAAIIDSQNTAQEPEIPPSNIPLTEENVEHLPDESHPPATLTSASTIGSNDPRNLTPLPNQQAPIGRPPLGGFATSAHRATSGSMRSASYQRRVQEQQEAVMMPGHNAVDRAAVQFGSMGLGNESGLDVDDEREDPETRQAPQQSPPSQPKTTLPPAGRGGIAGEIGIAESLSAKQAPGLPPASQHNQPQIEESSQVAAHDGSQTTYQQNQYGNYGQSGLQQDQQQKQYDPFGQQTQQAPYDRFGSQQQAQHQHQHQQQSQHHGHSGFGGLGAAPTDYNSSYYNADAQRAAYGQYYGSAGNYGSQEARSQGQQQDSAMSQQRSTSGYGSLPNESGFGSQQQQQTQSRYSETANSGHNTPNPHPASQQQGHPNAQQAGMHQQAPTQQHHSAYNAAAAAAGFPYGHPYYNSPYQQAYQNQFGYSPYGASYPSKQSGMYGAPYGQQVSSQPGYDQQNTATSAGTGYSQPQQQHSSTRTASNLSSGLGSGSNHDEYGRNSSQSTQGASGLSGMSDPFARGPSGFGQAGYASQTSAAGPEDSLKPFADQKTGSSPSLGQPGRPASAANNQSQAGSQAGHPQSQAGFGAYQQYQAQNSQYGSLGGLGGHQQGQAGQQQGGYSAYNTNAFAQYGSYNSRGGWGQSYGTH